MGREGGSMLGLGPQHHCSGQLLRALTNLSALFRSVQKPNARNSSHLRNSANLVFASVRTVLDNLSKNVRNPCGTGGTAIVPNNPNTNSPGFRAVYV